MNNPVLLAFLISHPYKAIWRSLAALLTTRFQAAISNLYTNEKVGISCPLCLQSQRYAELCVDQSGLWVAYIQYTPGCPPTHSQTHTDSDSEIK